MRDPPRGFSTCTQASTTFGCSMNFIGQVTDVQGPVAPRGKARDWSIQFYLRDHTNAGTTGLSVKFFRPMKNELPIVPQKGCFVVLRDIKVNNHPTFGMGSLSNYKTETVTFLSKAIPGPAFKDPIETGNTVMAHTRTPRSKAPTVDEQLYIIALKAEMSSAPNVAASAQPAPTKDGRSKFSLVKDLGPNTFRDLVGEVVKSFQVKGASEMDIYISDYTENSLLYLYQNNDVPGAEDGREGDPFGYASYSTRRNWLGPFGQCTLPIRLYESNADWARQNLKEGQIVFLKNVHLKISKAEKLEGALHQDRAFPNRADIRLLTGDDSRVKDVQQRKMEYEQRNARPVAEKKDAPGSKKHNKNKKKGGDKGKENAQELPDTTSGALEVVPSQNTHVRCAHHDVRLSSFSTILDGPERQTRTPGGVKHTLPFLSAIRRAKVRVIDFFPHKLEEFTNVYDGPAVPSRTQSGGKKKWVWAFYLRVVDASAPLAVKEEPKQLTLVVSEDRAEFLLKMDATNLRKDEKALAQLREKLFVLWGDLEEKKHLNGGTLGDAKVSNKAFECGIAEWGRPLVDGTYERRYALVKTTIM